MSISGIDLSNRRDTSAYPKIPVPQQDSAPPDQTMKMIYLNMQPHDEKFSIENLKKYTIYPGKSSAKVTMMAEIFTRVKNPLTGRFFLDPKTFAKMSDEKKKELSGPNLKALRAFQAAYMEEMIVPDGALGPIESIRILTIDIGVMLTQMDDPNTGKPYLNPKIFKEMPRLKQVKISDEYPPNSIYNALIKFLKDNRSPKDTTEVTPYTIIYKYPLLRQHWNKRNEKK